MALGRPRKDPRDPAVITGEAGLEPLEPYPGSMEHCEGSAWVPARPSYDVMRSPCITVLIRPEADPAQLEGLLPGIQPGGTVRLGVRQVLLAAHLIADLHVAHVAVEAALRRALTALAVRVGGLDAADPDGWEDAQDALLRAGRFDPAAVDGYITRYEGRFDLYHPVFPLLQDPRLAEECTKSSAPGRLAMTRASGNTQPWRNRIPEAVPVESGDALGWLLAWRDYGPCGTAAQRSHGGVTTKSAKSGPNRRTISYFPLGESLFASLVLGCPPPARWPQMPGADLAPWERENLPDPLAPTPASGPVSLLTGRSSHAVQLAPNADGSGTAACWIAWGTRTDLAPALDPFTMTTVKGTARIANARRALLRDFDTLVHARDASASDKSASRPPMWLGAFAALPPDLLKLVTGVRVRVLGCQQAAQAGGSEHWWSATTPGAIAPYLPARDHRRAALVTRAREATEAAAADLAGALRAAWRDMGSDPKQNPWPDRADASFWEQAEAPFWTTVSGPLPAEGEEQGLPDFRRIAVQIYDTVTLPYATTTPGMSPIAQHRTSVLHPRAPQRRKGPS